MSSSKLPFLAEEIVLKHVSYVLPTKQQNSHMKTIYVNYQNRPLMVQTPWLYSWDGVTLPSEKFRSDVPKYSVNCSLRGFQENEDVATFHSFLSDLDSKIIADAAANSQEWFKKQMSGDVCEALYARQLRASTQPDKYPPSFKLKIPHYDGVWKCDAYTPNTHASCSEGELNELIAGRCRIRFIMQCKGIWITGASKFGVSWTAAQVEYDMEQTAADAEQKKTGYQFKD
jgi:hypothetical protein